MRALRTDDGLMLAVRSTGPSGYEVVTPCFATATAEKGLEIVGKVDVLLDPGHGGDESGAIGANQLIEADVNLRVAEAARVRLTALGYRVLQTRYSDHRMAIQARAELANVLAPVIFMSIHHNGGYPDPASTIGTEVFFQRGDDRGSRLGGLVFEEITQAFSDVDVAWVATDAHGVSWRINESHTDLYGVLRRTPDLVSVLTEAMYLTNPAEAELMADPEVIQREAIALSRAVDRWFRTEDPGLGHIDGLIFRGELGTGGGTEGCVDPMID